MKTQSIAVNRPNEDEEYGWANESECVHVRMYVVPFYVKKRMVCKRKINTVMPRHCEWKAAETNTAMETVIVLV